MFSTNHVGAGGVVKRPSLILCIGVYVKYLRCLLSVLTHDSVLFLRVYVWRNPSRALPLPIW